MADEAIKKLLEVSSFSFIGTVEQFGAATMTNLTIDDHTAVVHVDHVLDAPPAFASLEGQRITVQLARDVPPPAAGEALAFFTQGLAFGESVAVTEVGRLPVQDVEPLATSALQAGAKAGAFAGMRNDLRLDRMRAHATESDAVVVGRVVKNEKAVAETGSEHDPDWWKTTIDVRQVERGDIAIGPLEVLYPNSFDVRWCKVPKPTAGADGVWFLHATQGVLHDAAPFQLLHPEDYQPVDQLDAMRQSGEKP